MNKMSPSHSSAGVPCRTRRLVRHVSAGRACRVGLTFIRFVSVLVCLCACAFALLWVLSMRANALPLGDSTANGMQIDTSRLGAHGAASRPSSIWIVVVPVAAALAGACLFRVAQRRAAQKAKNAADKRRIHCELAQPASRTSSNAPFAVESRSAQSKADHAEPQALVPSNVAVEGDIAGNVSFEPFEARYLQALSEEGIDLQTFLAGWRHAMDEDLAHLSALRRDGELDRLRGVLHRLSGAVGLVGACSLMEALRHTSVAPPAHNVSSIDALTMRMRTLVMQLETAAHAYRSTPQ
ncbi:hypothetical protein BX591_12681 [Paraburkholderia bryophila]|uniref:Hpt domain-containing protein n=2 Tax=Paraburkholderia bryophila TaxID=420952 RepID=A0A329BI04_9BURK|nr:hypothetical protein BX591_12681 [Paraburkholderia bryophila]